MLVDNAGGKEFKPDPLLDVDREYEARIVGVVHIGIHEKQKHDGVKFIEEFDEIEQAIIQIELTEEDTYVERGADDNKHLVPRTFPKFLKYSSHEKSGLFELAKSANTESAKVVGKKGQIETGKIIGHPISLTLKNNKDGDKQNIDKITSIPAKYKAGVDAMQSTPFQYSVMSGSHPLADGTVTTIADVPPWMLRFAIDKALNVDEFTEIDAMEAHLEALDAEKDGKTELEGDKLKTEPKAKAAAKPKAKAKEKVEEKVEEKSEPESESEEKVEEAVVEEKKPSSRRRRAATKPKEDEVDYASMELDELEDHFVKVCDDADQSEAVLDSVAGEAGEDDDKFRELLTAAIKAL